MIFVDVMFQVIITGRMKMTVFLDVALCSVAETDQRLHYQVLIMKAENTFETSVSLYQTYMKVFQ
jgi:hypothetical protein